MPNNAKLSEIKLNLFYYAIVPTSKRPRACGKCLLPFCLQQPLPTKS